MRIPSLRPPPALFGTALRDQILIVLAQIPESYPRELSQLLEREYGRVFEAVQSLEREGVVETRTIGRTRRVALNARWFAAAPFAEFLRTYAAAFPEVRERLETLRKRPRRIDKPL